MKNSTELIAMAKEIVKREMERSIEKDKQPSFFECIYEAYLKGLEDGSGVPADTISKAQDWHYIDLEGCPEDEERCWCLVQCDKYKDTERGWYDVSKKIWHLQYQDASFQRVLAWHKLPYTPD